MDVLFYTSVHILWLVKLIFGCCCTDVNDLECEIIGRRGGGVGSVDDGIEFGIVERFRRGNGSEFPSKFIWAILWVLGWRLDADIVDGKVKFPSDFVTNIAFRRLRPVRDFRETRDCGVFVWLGDWRPIATANRLRFRCSTIITQTR
jgi:hypothetical protein